MYTLNALVQAASTVPSHHTQSDAFVYAWQYTIFNWLSAQSSIQLSPTWLTVLVAGGPVLLMVLLFYVGKLCIALARFLASVFVDKFSKQLPTKELLQITFPAQTSKSAYATEQLYALFHTLSLQMSWLDQLAQRKNEYSLEIVSTKAEGIRYIVAASPRFCEIISRSISSYLPGVRITPVSDYYPEDARAAWNGSHVGFVELKLARHFALSLETQKVLSQNDPISYLTGTMTKLLPGELVAYQIIASPVTNSGHPSLISEMQKLRTAIYKSEPLTQYVHKSPLTIFLELPGISVFAWLVVALIKLTGFAVMFTLSMIIAVHDTSGKSVPFFKNKSSQNAERVINPYERELQEMIKNKIEQRLFETSIRLLVVTQDLTSLDSRMDGIVAAFGQMTSPYQALIEKSHIKSSYRQELEQFRKRVLSRNTVFNQNPVVSTSELSDLFHFPHTDTTQMEDMVKVHSKLLPAPLTVKNTPEFDVVFGTNGSGNSASMIGLTDDDRSRHVYMIGQTGSGKSTILFHMAKDDIRKGRGVAVLDPHGDLASDLLATVPDDRAADCIYFNPFDLKYPIGINLLELTPGLENEELEQEKELVCESVIAVFRRVFSNDEQGDAHRIEYILRNTIYTAFTVSNCTIFTVYDLLNDPKFQRSVTKHLEDENLKNFWKNEFGKAGSFQVVKMVSGVTAKVGRFLFSPTARRILEQPRSTINFDNILETQKILLCNLSEGKIGEDTSKLLGTTIISKLQQAAMRRSRKKLVDRTPFYLFIDEFQNFATSSFTRLLSGGRKFGLRLTIAEQSTAQQDDRNVTNIILANTGTIISFRTASPMDESILLSQFSPYVEKGEIGNLPRFHFYIKLGAVEPEEPFSGTTLPMQVDHDEERLQTLIQFSRMNYAIEYKSEDKKHTVQVAAKQKKKTTQKVNQGGTLATYGLKK